MLKPTPVPSPFLNPFLKLKKGVTPAIIVAAYEGDTKRLLSLSLTPALNATHPVTGMTALHIAIGRNNLEMTKALVEAGAAFVPDNEGRMPSVIAAEMEVSEELADYIYEAESRALQGQGQEDV
jgi:uncharacterized protein